MPDNKPIAVEPWPAFDEEMREAADRVLRSGRVNYWTGDEGVAFEREFAEYVGVPHAVALSNGTVALELALRACGVGPGDEVIVPCRTFIATASAAAAVGARPVFADVDRDSQNLSVETIEPRLTPRTKAIIPVHLAGWPCDMTAITSLARRHGLAVIEDCSQAHGAEHAGRRVGSFGDAAAFSFCQDKVLTTAGEGGVLVTRRDDVYQAAARYKDHGKPPELRIEASAPGAGYRWVHDTLGSNHRMSEVQSAIGRVQLRRLDGWLTVRRRNAQRLNEACLAAGCFRVPMPAPRDGHAFYKFYAFVRLERLQGGWTRDRLIKALRERGVPCGVGSCGEVHRERAFPANWRPKDPLPIAAELFRTSLMLTVHPTMSDATLERVCDAIRDVAHPASTRAEAA